MPLPKLPDAKLMEMIKNTAIRYNKLLGQDATPFIAKSRAIYTGSKEKKFAKEPSILEILNQAQQKLYLSLTSPTTELSGFKSLYDKANRLYVINQKENPSSISPYATDHLTLREQVILFYNFKDGIALLDQNNKGSEANELRQSRIYQDLEYLNHLDDSIKSLTEIEKHLKTLSNKSMDEKINHVKVLDQLLFAINLRIEIFRMIVADNDNTMSNETTRKECKVILEEDKKNNDFLRNNNKEAFELYEKLKSQPKNMSAEPMLPTPQRGRLVEEPSVTRSPSLFEAKTKQMEKQLSLRELKRSPSLMAQRGIVKDPSMTRRPSLVEDTKPVFERKKAFVQFSEPKNDDPSVVSRKPSKP